MKKIFLIILILTSANLFSQETLTVGTITEAHDWAASAELKERVTIKKIIFTDSIAGDDYNPVTSEWYWFRYLDELFPYIEEVEVRTDQDIPDWEYSPNNINLGFFTGALWLKSFSAPFIKYRFGCFLAMLEFSFSKLSFGRDNKRRFF